MIFLNIPTISKLQWHPFSIISSANINHDKISVMIKCEGWWTTTLYNKIQSILPTYSSTSSLNHVLSLPVVSFEGPYGPCDDHLFQKYDRLVLIAGGSGITPYLSFIEEACGRNHISSNNYSDMKMNRRKIQLIYVVKNSSDLSMLMPISSLLLLNESSSSHFLHLQAFVTREKRNQTRTVKEIMEGFSQQVQTIQTTPSDHEHPNAPNMFSCNWSKMVMTGLCASIFLVSSVLLKPQCIPVFGSFLISVGCCWIVAVVAVKNGKREKHGNCGEIVREMKTICVNESSSSILESDRHKVYYGSRPVFSGSIYFDQFYFYSNLFFMCFADLMEFKGEEGGDDDVGVFVCGPDSMQETVAVICRKYGRRSTNNCSFHFHSIKFSL